MSGNIVGHVTFRAIEPVSASRVRAEVAYNPDDPAVIRLVLSTRRQRVPWTVGRELLRDGLAAAAGQGDVRIRTRAGSTRITLDTPDGCLVLAAPTRVLKECLDATYDLVADGDEWELAVAELVRVTTPRGSS